MLKAWKKPSFTNNAVCLWVCEDGNMLCVCVCLCVSSLKLKQGWRGVVKQCQMDRLLNMGKTPHTNTHTLTQDRYQLTSGKQACCVYCVRTDTHTRAHTHTQPVRLGESECLGYKRGVESTSESALKFTPHQGIHKHLHISSCWISPTC